MQCAGLLAGTVQCAMFRVTLAGQCNVQDGLLRGTLVCTVCGTCLLIREYSHAQTSALAVQKHSEGMSSLQIEAKILQIEVKILGFVFH